MTSNKAATLFADQGADFILNRTLDAADISDQDIIPKVLQWLYHPRHRSSGHGEDNEIGAFYRFRDIASGVLAQAFAFTQKLNDGITASPGPDFGLGESRTDRPDQGAPNQTRSENRNALKRLSVVRAQGTLK